MEQPVFKYIIVFGIETTEGSKTINGFYEFDEPLNAFAKTNAIIQDFQENAISPLSGIKWKNAYILNVIPLGEGVKELKDK
jgi:hypothetical protein